MSARVFVGNLPYDTTQEELRVLLAPAGTIVDVHLPADRETGRPRGFAFVEFSAETEAEEAVRRFGQVEVRGRRLNINPADDRARRGPRLSAPGPPPESMPFDRGQPPGRRFKTKGSRRGLRRRKRSL